MKFSVQLSGFNSSSCSFSEDYYYVQNLKTDMYLPNTSSTRVLVELTPVPPDADELTLFWGGAPGAENYNK